jgi:hypothetical protein
MGGPGSSRFEAVCPSPQRVLLAPPPRLLSHRVAATSLLPFVQGAERCGVPGHRSDTSSSPSCSTWRLKSTNALWACMTLGPRILVTNTQVVSGRRPGVSFTKASFKMGSVSPDAAGCTVWAGHSGSRVVMSGLEMGTKDLVSMVTRYVICSVRPSACGLSWPCFSDM